jgi:hypothetical protein
MNAANIPRKLRLMLWRKAFQAATILNGIDEISIEAKSGTQCGHWDGNVRGESGAV